MANDGPGGRLHGARVLVTGATGDIGSALARRPVKSGAQVTLVARSARPLRELAAELGPSAFPQPADVTDAASISAAVDAAAMRAGGVDAVVANAGVMASGRVEDMDLDELRRVIEVNLLGTWLTLRSSTPHLARAGG